MPASETGVHGPMLLHGSGMAGHTREPSARPAAAKSYDGSVPRGWPVVPGGCRGGDSPERADRKTFAEGSVLVGVTGDRDGPANPGRPGDPHARPLEARGPPGDSDSGLPQRRE